MNKKISLFLGMISILFCINCTHEDISSIPEENCTDEDISSIPEGITDLTYRTLFVYAAGDNDLSSMVNYNLSQIKKGMDGKAINGRVICLADIDGLPTRLLEITSDGIDTLKDYRKNLNTADPYVFKSAFEDVCKNAPSKRYGLVMWSHGSGWLPGTSTRSFGLDHGYSMNMNDMLEAFSGINFDYILFDACLMSSIELIYELREKTRYILASPTETTSGGYPYDVILPMLFAEDENLEDSLIKVADTYYESYKEGGEGVTVTLSSTKGLENLANKIKELNADLTKVDRSSVQKLSVNGQPMYDFQKTYELADKNNSVDWKDALNKVVLREHHTDFYGIGKYIYPGDPYIDIKYCCGLTSYIPTKSNDNTDRAYMNTAWYKDTHSSSSTNNKK